MLEPREREMAEKRMLAGRPSEKFSEGTGEALDRVAAAVGLSRPTLHRRHLDESQRAMVAAKVSDLPVGSNQHTKQGAQICAPSQADAADMLNVSRRSVQTARRVLDHGTPELRDAGESTRDIAQVLGVDHSTAARDIAAVANATPSRPQRSEINDLAAPSVANATFPPADAPAPAAAPTVLDTVAALAAAASRFMRLAS